LSLRSNRSSAKSYDHRVNPMPSVAIVGGGMAGLAAAYELSRRHVPFVLLEAGPRLGGVVLSEQIDGYTIDGGPDALLIQKPEGIKLCEELGLGDQLVPTKLPRLAFIQRDGRLHALPAGSVLGIPTTWGPFIKTRLFSWAGKARMGAELFVPARRDGGDESIGAFMTRRFGIEATTYLAEPLLAGIHAGDVNRLSVRALFPRFVEEEHKHGSLLRAFRRQPARQASPDGAFKSLPGGLSDMVRALVATLPAESIRLRTPVSRIQKDGETFRIETGSGDHVEARTVVLAAPAFAASAILRSLSPALSQLCGEIPYASAATIALAFNRDAVSHPLNGSGFVVPKVENTGIMAGSWLSSKWPNRAPAGRVLLRAFVGGARDPAALEKSDSELVSAAMAALRPLLGIAGEPLLKRVYRWDRANAQHEVGHLALLARIETALSAVPGLHLTGSGYRGVGIPDCVADGRATARKVCAWLDSPVTA
jgi:oxygen-dependent protoporphyrinogen oxidase